MEGETGGSHEKERSERERRILEDAEAAILLFKSFSTFYSKLFSEIADSTGQAVDPEKVRERAPSVRFVSLAQRLIDIQEKLEEVEEQLSEILDEGVPDARTWYAYDDLHSDILRYLDTCETAREQIDGIGPHKRRKKGLRD